MRSKKWKIPTAVQAHLERKAQLTSSMAQRQAAGMGRAARVQLKPLLDAAPVKKEKDYVVEFGSLFSDAAKRMADHWLSSLQSPMWVIPPSQAVWAPLTLSWDTGLPAPTINTEQLKVLKTAEAHKPQLRVPDMVQVITGWRAWKLKGGLLSALGVDATWPIKEAIRAACRNGGNESHLAPYWNCQCGIWAFKDIDRLVAAIGSGYSDVSVLGSVSLWGRVIETENGYRAQYAYPSELWLLNPALEELGLLYGVPVRSA